MAMPRRLGCGMVVLEERGEGDDRDDERRGRRGGWRRRGWRGGRIGEVWEVLEENHGGGEKFNEAVGCEGEQRGAVGGEGGARGDRELGDHPEEGDGLQPEDGEREEAGARGGTPSWMSSGMAGLMIAGGGGWMQGLVWMRELGAVIGLRVARGLQIDTGVRETRESRLFPAFVVVGRFEARWGRQPSRISNGLYASPSSRGPGRRHTHGVNTWFESRRGRQILLSLALELRLDAADSRRERRKTSGKRGAN